MKTNQQYILDVKRMQENKRLSWASQENSEGSNSANAVAVGGAKKIKTDAPDGSVVAKVGFVDEPKQLSQAERLGPGDEFTDPDQQRIQETVEKL